MGDVLRIQPFEFQSKIYPEMPVFKSFFENVYSRNDVTAEQTPCSSAGGFLLQDNRRFFRCVCRRFTLPRLLRRWTIFQRHWSLIITYSPMPWWFSRRLPAIKTPETNAGWRAGGLGDVVAPIMERSGTWAQTKPHTQRKSA